MLVVRRIRMEFARTVRSSLSVPGKSPSAYDFGSSEVRKGISASPLYLRQNVHVVPAVVCATDALYRSYLGDDYRAGIARIAVSVAVAGLGRERSRDAASRVNIRTSDGASTVNAGTCPCSRSAARSRAVI